MRQHSSNCKGMVTALFAGIVLPVLFLMFTVTVELSQFFGVREEVQQALDRQAHDTLRFGVVANDVEQALRRQLGNVGDVVNITDVTVQQGVRQARVSAQITYNGMFLPIVEAFFGLPDSLLSMTVQSQVAIQSAAALLVLDRSVLVGQDVCTTPSLQARQVFMDNLYARWIDVASGGLSVAVFPGESEPVEQVLADGSDGLGRCGSQNPARPLDLQSLEGRIDTVFDAYDVAFSMRDLVGEQLVSQAVRKRVVVLVMSQERYMTGYAAAVANVLSQATNGALFPIDMITMVVDDSGIIDYRPSGIGIHGGLYREIGASESELRGSLLVSTVSQLVRGNLVVEQ